MLRQLSISSKQQQHATLYSIAENECSSQPMLSKRIMSKTKTFTCLTALSDEPPAVVRHDDSRRDDDDDEWGFFDDDEPNELSQTSSESQPKPTQ
jgi:hypothetical protein